MKQKGKFWEGERTWENLLRNIAREIGEYQYEYCANQIDSNLSYCEKQSKIASLLEEDFNKNVFKEDKYANFRNENDALIKSNISPFKINIANVFKKKNLNFNQLDNDKKKEIELLRKLQIRNISGIITTNYDNLIEELFEDYKIYIGQNELIFSDILEIGEIYKIHGSCNNPDSIIITEEDYTEFDNKNAYLIAKLLTIFLEYPIIFIGYSIEDKNIQSILKSIAFCLPNDKLQILRDRFIFVEYDEHKEEVGHQIHNFGNSSIEMTKITTNNFYALYKGIMNVKANYNPKILRQLRQDIYSLVDKNKSTEKILVTDFKNIDNIQEYKQVVIGVGMKEYTTVKPTLIKAEEIYEDVILDNRDLNLDAVIEKFLPYLLGSNPGGLPIFKYIINYKKEIKDKRIKEQQKRIKSIDNYLNNSIRKSKRNYMEKLKKLSVDGIIEHEGFDNAYKKIIYLDENYIDLNQLEEYLHKLLERNGNSILKGNSELKRLIRIYDFLKFT